MCSWRRVYGNDAAIANAVFGSWLIRAKRAAGSPRKDGILYNNNADTQAQAAPEPGLAFGYAFDAIGNRTSSTVSGAATAGAAHVTGYTANALNQYTGRTSPGVAVARGVVHEAAALTVNGGEPTLLRSGERWLWERAVDNSGGAAWQGVEVVATRAGVGQGGGDVSTTRSGAVYVPPASEAITHDADGNLTGDGRWAYTWDCDNRLIAMETKPALVSAGAPRQRLEFGYDAGHRRISKVVKSLSSSLNAWSVASQTLYLYDGWNLIAEFEVNQQSGIKNLKSTYEWGLDLSGTMTGAGGVGGLLIIRSHSSTTANNSQALQTTPTSSHGPCYDGNGNLTALVNLATGQTEARYDYGPFGERVLVAGGAIAEANPFRFSTKYEDAETGLLYYGYRFYDSVAGRWLNRDPIGERGGLNLFGGAGNNLVNKLDVLGLKQCCCLDKQNKGHRMMPSQECCVDGVIKKGEVCTITVYVSHSGPATEKADEEDESDKIGHACCHQQDVNGNVPEDKQYPNADRGNGPVYWDFDKDGEPSPTMEEEVNQEIEAAKEEAKRMCNPNHAKKCCNEVQIKLRSGDKDGQKWLEAHHNTSRNSPTKTVHTETCDKGCTARGGRD